MAGPRHRPDVTRAFTNLFDEPDVQAPALGEIYQDGNGNSFRFVLNHTGGTTAIGDVVALDFTVNYPNAVIGVATASLMALAGVCMAVATSAQYLWIQYAGNCANVLVESTTDIVVGDSLKGVNGQAYVVHDTAIGTIATYVNNIRATVGRTSNDTGLIAAYVNCRWF